MLYNIVEEYKALLDAIESGEIPEDAISDTLEAAGGELADKVDSVACYIKQLRAEAAAIKTEADALTDRRKAKENKADRLTAYLLECLNRLGQTKMETARSVVQVKKNPPSVQIADEAKFIEWARDNMEILLTFPEPKPNKPKIKEAINLGNDVPLCALTQGESLKVG